MKKVIVKFDHDAKQAPDILVYDKTDALNPEVLKAQKCLSFALELGSKSPKWLLSLVHSMVTEREEGKDVTTLIQLAEYFYNNLSEETIDTVGMVFMKEHLSEMDMGEMSDLVEQVAKCITGKSK